MNRLQKYSFANMFRDAAEGFTKVCVAACVLVPILAVLTFIAKFLYAEIIWIWNALPF